ncbi:MAG TPA: NAD(P)/FAD-dependent oxidoreductase [Candidatus Caenarcaniphilales bacterium]
MTQGSQQICILGGGFGGLYTALRLSELPWPQQSKPNIVLVDKSDRFLFSPFLYELMTGELQTWEIALPFEEILANTGVRFLQAAVDSVDLEQKQVQLQEGPTLNYDRLVLALGGETPLNRVAGATDYALSFRSIQDAYRLEEKLRVLEESEVDKIRVAIIGAGYCGVELACKLADRLKERGRLRLIEQGDQILRSSSSFNQDAARLALEKRGIWIDLETTVKSVESHQMALQYKGQVDSIPVEIVLWTAGITVANWLQSLPFKHNSRGQLVTTAMLQVVDQPEIFALGDLADCCDAEGKQVPHSAQAAYQQADYVGWNLWASLTGRPLLPFRYFHLGELLTLGTDAAAFSGLGLKLDGSLAYLMRRLAYLYRMPTLEHQLKVGLNWILHPLVKAGAN